MAEDSDFPEKAILKKRGDKSTYDWVAIIVQYVIPRIAEFRKEGILPTVRGIFYFLTDTQVVSKLHKIYKGFDRALVDARKKKPGDKGYIPLGTFSDNTRRIIDIYDKYEDLDTQIFIGIHRTMLLTDTFKDSIPRWLGQPNYVEVWIEKRTLTGTIRSILTGKEVRIAPNGGWSSLEFLNENIERLEDQITRKDFQDFDRIKHIWILYVGDFDPSGLKMDGHYQKALTELQNRLGGQVHIHFKRIALTWDQIKTFKLEHLKNAALSDKDRERLENDPNAGWFKEQYDGSLFQIQSDSLQTLQPRKFKELITKEVDDLYDEKIRKKILALPEHSLPPEKIWRKIKSTWIYEAYRFGYESTESESISDDEEVQEEEDREGR